MSFDMTSNPPSPSRVLASARAWAREHGPAVLVEVLVNFAAPFLLYSAAKQALGDAGALMAASAPPLAWSVVTFVRHRRVDALSVLVLLGIMLSLLAFFGGGGAKFLQLREHLVLAVVGMVFLGSAAIGKPLIYQLARARLRRRRADDQLAVFEAVSEHPIFRRAMLTMTLAWGFGLVIESAIACVLVFALPIATFLLVSPIFGYGVGIGLTAWTFWYARRRVLAARAAVMARAD